MEGEHMSTVEIAQQPLLIGGNWTAAQDGVQQSPREYPI
jgi:hypothetical protein